MSATSLTVEVCVTVKVRQSLNLVDLFQQMNELAQKRYRDLDIAELGMEAEWERPLAYLWPEDDDLVPFNMVPGAPSVVRGGIDDAHVLLTERGMTPVHGRDAHWTEGDFETLTAQVPWLRNFHERLRTPLTQYEVDRIPGPDDMPLF